MAKIYEYEHRLIKVDDEGEWWSYHEKQGDWVSDPSAVNLLKDQYYEIYRKISDATAEKIIAKHKAWSAYCKASQAAEALAEEAAAADRAAAAAKETFQEAYQVAEAAVSSRRPEGR